MNITDWFFLLNSIQSETPFDGAYGNLKRLFDKAAKMYHQVKKQEMKKLSPSRQRCVRSLLYTYNRQDGGVFLKMFSVFLLSKSGFQPFRLAFHCSTQYSEARHIGYNITTGISAVCSQTSFFYFLTTGSVNIVNKLTTIIFVIA